MKQSNFKAPCCKPMSKPVPVGSAACGSQWEQCRSARLHSQSSWQPAGWQFLSPWDQTADRGPNLLPGHSACSAASRRFVNNTAGVFGGAIYHRGAVSAGLNISGGVFSGNSASEWRCESLRAVLNPLGWRVMTAAAGNHRIPATPTNADAVAMADACLAVCAGCKAGAIYANSVRVVSVDSSVFSDNSATEALGTPGGGTLAMQILPPVI